MRHIKLTFVLLGIVLLSLGVVRGQQSPQQQQQQREQQQQQQPDPFAGNLFPPEFIMQHQQALGLSEEQVNFLKADLRKTQTRLLDLQWGLQDEVEKLTAMMKQDQVDEAQVLTQLDKVLAQEREIKHTNIGLLIRIKNKLTPEQQTRLREIASKSKD